mmetsp:Transcript_26580/g.58256  ORF Transcript_26580/g.58256 Transcript_26580/m.58256 type:complete len:158 (+) Transcript_26580:700-1173(+)
MEVSISPGSGRRIPVLGSTLVPHAGRRPAIALNDIIDPLIKLFLSICPVIARSSECRLVDILRSSSKLSLETDPSATTDKKGSPPFFPLFSDIDGDCRGDNDRPRPNICGSTLYDCASKAGLISNKACIPTIIKNRSYMQNTIDTTRFFNEDYSALA